jgi:hypothetical protein
MDVRQGVAQIVEAHGRPGPRPLPHRPETHDRRGPLQPAALVQLLRNSQVVDALEASGIAWDKLDAWGMLAYFSVTRKVGIDAGDLDLWHMDVVGGLTLLDEYDYGGVLFAGPGYFSASGADDANPGAASGRAVCNFWAPRSAYCVFDVELWRAVPDLDAATPQVSFFIDGLPLGQLEWDDPGHPVRQELIAHTEGHASHSLEVRQDAGSYFWLGTTVWTYAPPSEYSRL